ncbi:MAG: hypothetical protein KUG78_01700 [Kangiellaceae bacterium]|nr:hypothetical protein [Kangiellaceae bacterium]
MTANHSYQEAEHQNSNFEPSKFSEADYQQHTKAVTESNPSSAAANKETNTKIETPRNSIVDVFEFEPVGFMSKGRW